MKQKLIAKNPILSFPNKGDVIRKLLKNEFLLNKVYVFKKIMLPEPLDLFHMLLKFPKKEY